MDQVDLASLKLLELCDLQVFFFNLTTQFMLRLLAAINFVVISKQQALNGEKKKGIP